MGVVDMDLDIHEFMTRIDGSLSKGAEQIPQVREFIEELPPTAASFKLRDVPDLEHSTALDMEHMEFLKCWKPPEHFQRTRKNQYINPGHAHAYHYTDHIAECKCGAILARFIDRSSGGNPLQNSHNHSDDCKPQWRMRARARLAEEREQEMLRLGPMGWRSRNFAARFGLTTRSGVNGLPQRYGFTFTELRNEYRRLAANTYTHFVLNTTTTGEEICEIYGHAPATISEWRREYGDGYDDGRYSSPNKAANQHTGDS